MELYYTYVQDVLYVPQEVLTKFILIIIAFNLETKGKNGHCQASS